VKRVCDGALDGLVVLGERTIVEAAERDEDTSYAFGIHDERTQVIFGWRVGFEIGHIVADPGLFCLVPPDLAAGRIPGLAVHVAGGSVIEHAAIRRPRPRPIGIDSEARGIFGSAAR